jgi:Predicted membrane protein (DUF2207) C-terminal domain
MHTLFSTSRPAEFVLPFALCCYYAIALLLVGKNPSQGAIVARYQPPANMTPAEVRYLFTGSTDRKTVAAVLVHLAAQKLITIRPENGDYRITMLVEQPPDGIAPEEAAAMRAIAEVYSFFNPNSKTCKGGSFLLKPAEKKHVSLIGSVISGAVNSRVEQTCFRRNLRYSAPAFLTSLVIVLGMAAHYQNHGNGVFFLTLWFMFCSFIVGIITALTVVPALFDALRGRVGGTNIWTAMVPLLMFGGVLGFVAYRIAEESTPAFAQTLIAVVVINIGFAISLKRLTPTGRERLDEVLGFRQFLSTVELDWLDRMNVQQMTPALMNDYLAYAIALDLKEAWGDHLSSALFSTATSAG